MTEAERRRAGINSILKIAGALPPIEEKPAPKKTPKKQTKGAKK